MFLSVSLPPVLQADPLLSSPTPIYLWFPPALPLKYHRDPQGALWPPDLLPPLSSLLCPTGRGHVCYSLRAGDAGHPLAWFRGSRGGVPRPPFLTPSSVHLLCPPAARMTARGVLISRSSLLPWRFLPRCRSRCLDAVPVFLHSSLLTSLASSQPQQSPAPPPLPSHSSLLSLRWSDPSLRWASLPAALKNPAVLGVKPGTPGRYSSLLNASCNPARAGPWWAVECSLNCSHTGKRTWHVEEIHSCE